MDLQINLMRSADLPQVQNLANETILTCYADFLGAENVAQYVESGLAAEEFITTEGEVYTVKLQGVLVGTVILKEHLLHLMMVHPEVQWSGIGTAMMQFIEAQLEPAEGAIYLETFAENEPAINFYKKMGWKEKHKIAEPNLGVTRVTLYKQK